MRLLPLSAMFLLSAAMLLKPRWLWRAETMFNKKKNGEPPDSYYKSMKTGGVFLLICSIAASIYILLL